MADGSGKKTCYYELLGLDRKCEPVEIKSSYRKIALKMHPDKAHINGITVEEATQKFQVIQEAYSVLSDPQERAWYDAHREQILQGNDGSAEDPFKTRINLYQFFSTSCFQGFGDGAKGFYAVYSDLFVAIDTEEAEWEDADEDHVAMPPFAGSDAVWADVSAFYRHWLDFCSRKAFGHADKWNPKEAQNRQVRRAMEQENKQARKAAKKEFNAEVRQLVQFVQKRDPRVAAHEKESAKASAEKAQKEAKAKEEQKAEKAKEARERKENARIAEEERWAEVEAERDARRARGEVVSDEESESEEEVGYACEPCRKTFQSEKAFDNHTRSKKHLQVVEKLRRALDAEMEAEAAEAEASDDELLAMEGGGAVGVTAALEEKLLGEFKPPARAPAPAQEKKAPVEEPEPAEEEEEEDDESDEDAFLARFAAGTKLQRAAPSSSEEESDDGEEPGPVEAAGAGGKRAQKKAQQTAILKEKAKQAAEKAADRAAKDAAEEQPEGEAAGAGAETGEAEAEGAPGLTEANGSGGAGGLSEKCQVCNEEFSSRSKLFTHIKATGHAALKTAVPPEASGKKGKKKR